MNERFVVVNARSTPSVHVASAPAPEVRWFFWALIVAAVAILTAARRYQAIGWLRDRHGVVNPRPPGSVEGVLWAALSGLVFALLTGRVKRRADLKRALPFGPFLSLGAWLTWLYGPLAAVP